MNAPVDEKILAGVKTADEHAAARSKIPTAAELFPGMRQQVTEYFMWQLTIYSMQRPAFSDALHWWNEQMDVRDRRFVCRFAKRPLEFAEQSWLAIGVEDRCRLVAAFMWIYSWANNFHPPMQPYVQCLMEP